MCYLRDIHIVVHLNFAREILSQKCYLQTSFGGDYVSVSQNGFEDILQLLKELRNLSSHNNDRTFEQRKQKFSDSLSQIVKK